MPDEYLGLPQVEFADEAALRAWLQAHHAASAGVWVRVARSGSSRPSVTFEQLLDQGLCFGWSESLRHKGDSDSYLQKFTPRRTRGTTSARNLAHARMLVETGQMTAAGSAALGLEQT